MKSKVTVKKAMIPMGGVSMKRKKQITCSGVVALVTGAAIASGIPEPGSTMYGVIKNNIGGATVRMSAGTMTWTFVPPSGPPVTVQAELQNINDQFSYVLDIPFETMVPGESPTTNALQMQATAQMYDRSQVLVGTNVAVISAPATATFSFSQANRAEVKRVDLELNAPPADTDGDGLSDFWEDLYFGGVASPELDADGDGVNNLDEYLAGTIPVDRSSLFDFISVIEESSGGFRVTWDCEMGRFYTISRSENLMSGFSEIAKGINATPPVNEYMDGTATNAPTYFYRIELE